jgi:type IV pilus assembly protein PilY1
MPRHQKRIARSANQWPAALGALLATLLAAPAAADIQIPDDPLTTGSRVAPNVLFILDDSGSMAFDYMPDNLSNDWRRQSYVHNAVYYNPALTYQPWVRSDGERMSGGTSYSAAYGSFNLVGGNTIDLGSSSSCRRFNYNTNATSDELSSGGTNVCGGVQTYYVPKTELTGAARNVEANYYRYQIMEGANGAVVRSERGSAVVSNSDLGPWTGLSGNNGMQNQTSFDVPAGATRLTVTSAGGSFANLGGFGSGADLYVRAGANPTTSNNDCAATGNGNNHTCTINSPQAGQWRFALNSPTSLGSYSNVTVTVRIESSNRCDGGTGTGTTWINCTEVTPTGRTVEQEKSNYATWFSYHRTRMKAAKAGASEAFVTIDGKVRVGFRTIWGRSGTTFNIPVNDGNDGRFVDSTGTVTTTSRSTWYSRLHNVIGYNGTPLHDALDAAGTYFQSSAQSGPYGPQSGSNQYSCRQNFAILTTDGYWNNVGVNVGNQDNTAGQTITGPNSRSFRYSPSAPYQDSYSNTLADVAMKYWKTDLRDNMTNNVPTTTANPAFWQHMVTFGISIGLSGNKGWSSVEEVPSNATWADPTDTEDADRIDDLLHAAVNGRGAFVSASNPSEFTAGLREALSAIQQRTSSYSNVATNSVSLDSDTMTFSASYVAGTWTGAVNARQVTRAGVSDSIAWVSSIPSLSNRKVFTTTGSAGATFPTTTQEAALARGGGRANFAVSGEDNAKYIKGETRLEERRGTSNLRNRIATVLGDIVGSSPAYVKDTNTLYVGANDGMLHAFDARTGQELFAYVPGLIANNPAKISDLSTLSRGDYFHKWFVDGPIVVSSKALTSNRNILIGALGKGGRGLFALDVTNPSTVTAANLFKWELAETSGRNMGLVMGRPVLGEVNGTAVAAVGNGINSQRDRAVLLVINAETGAVVREMDTGVGSATQPNGLSAPVGVFGPDGKTLRYVYAGDMLGNVWKFDLTSATSTPTRIFTAGIGSGVQPISGSLTVAVDPRTRKRWIFFGTGRFLTVEDADATATTVQSMYGIIEGETAPTRADLTRRTVAVTGATSDGYEVRAFEAKTPLPDGSRGWYIDLPGTGERIVQDAQRVSNILVTASMIPTGDACEASGTGYINALDAFTGTSAGSSFFDLDGDGTTSDQTAGGNPVGSVNYGVGMPTVPNILRGQLVVSGTGVGGDETSGAGKGQGSGITALRWDRVSWREIRSE